MMVINKNWVNISKLYHLNGLKRTENINDFFSQYLNSNSTFLSLYHTILSKKDFRKHHGKRKELNASNQLFSSFPHNVLFPIKDRNSHLSYIQFVDCKCFQFDLV